jgi:hypothetical protein
MLFYAEMIMCKCDNLLKVKIVNTVILQFFFINKSVRYYNR